LNDIIGPDLQGGYPIRFESEDKVVEMRILPHMYDKPPTLCILGPDNSDLLSLIEQVNREGRALRAINEIRSQNLVWFALERLRMRYAFDYEQMPVTRSTEGLVKRPEEPLTLNKGDLAVDIGQTFSTARNNGLKVYGDPLMQTYPVEFVCYKKDERGRPYGKSLTISLQDLKRKFRENGESYAPSTNPGVVAQEIPISQEKTSCSGI
jgi:hypothetical protein